MALGESVELCDHDVWTHGVDRPERTSPEGGKTEAEDSADVTIAC
jgi:hypothetical protein